MEQLDEIIKEFLVESHENLDELDRSLVMLESNPEDRGRLAAIFRTVHTIKGTCGFLGLGKLERVTHVGENLLSKLRDGELRLQPEITTGLLTLVDAIRQMLANVEATGGEGDADYAELVQTLIDLQSLGKDVQAAIAPTPVQAPSTSGEAAAAGTPIPSVPAAEAAGNATATSSTAATDGNGAPSGAPALPVPVQSVPVSPAISPPPADSAEHPNPGPIPARTGEAVAAEGTPATGSTPASGTSSSVSESSIRVDVALLEKLMTRVGELVLARNQILQLNNSVNDAALQNAMQRLNLITSELQEGVMKTRMQPIGNVWSKFPRVVRDLSAMCGKEVRIEMEGKETELDKTIIEAIKDPLTHLIRNTVDHGIERPEVRRQAGKAVEGLLRLRAFHEGGQVIIEIIDDGAGLNLERIRNKAVEKGLISPEAASRLADRDAAQLIFLPGFSTAEKVSNVSGRGVGMDVVKTNIEKIGGSVDLQTRSGQGTTIRIKIPLTLAIIPALIVSCDGDRYAIPQVNLLELVRIEADEVETRVEWIQGAPVYRLRGRLLPLVYLRNVLEIGPGQTGSAARAVNIVVLRADDREFGLVVDAVRDTEEIVVKPLSKQLKGIPAYAGMTIMGDGKVALILDVIGLAQSAHVLSASRGRSVNDTGELSGDSANTRQTLLVLGVGESHRYAIPIHRVTRLEKLPASSIELADQREVVQYRGEILPLARLSQLLAVPAGVSGDLLEVVVFTERGTSVGLIVDQVLDIVEADLTGLHSAHSNGVIGTAVIGGKITDLLDYQAVIHAIDPDLHGSGNGAEERDPVHV